MLPESALISFRRIVSPAPAVGLYSQLSACACSADGAFIREDAWPNASEAPNPAMV